MKIMIKKKKTKKVIRITIITCMIILIGNIFDIASFRDCAHAITTTFKNTPVYLERPFVRNDTSICLNWYNMYDSTGYEIYRAVSKNGTYKKIATTTSKTYCAHYYDKTPKLGKLYYYRVKAYKNYNGKKIYSKFSNKKSVRMTLPETDFKKVSISSNGEVICTYKKLKNANGYYIYHSTDGKNFTRIKTVSTNTPHTSFSLNDLPEENYFKVRGYIRAGDKRYLGQANSDAFYYDRPINIENSELKKALQNEIGNRTITRKVLKTITHLEFEPSADNDYKGYDLGSCTSADFAFLRYCTNLRRICINECKLGNLSNITDNIIPGNEVTELSLVSNNLTNLNGIEKFKNLKEVDLSDNDLVQLNGIEKCSELRNISLGNNPIRSFAALENLTNVDELLYSYLHRMYREQTEDEPYEFTNFKGYKEIREKLGLPVTSYELEWAAAEDKMDRFIYEQTTSSMSDYEKVKAAHDYIVSTMSYGNSEGNHVWLYNDLILGKGVCQDYAEAYGMLLARMGFHAEYVSGDDPIGGEGHAWNIVKLDGKYYHVDCTWDDPQDNLRYNYFLKSDKTLRALRVYTWDTSVHPACPDDY